LAAAILFSIVTLGLAAHIASTPLIILNALQGLGIAASVMTIVSLSAFLIVGFLQKRAPLNMNVVEIPVMGFLTIIWLASAGRYASLDLAFGDCDLFFFPKNQMVCSELKAAEAFSFFNWIILGGYTGATIIMCLIGKHRGNDVWFVGANEVDYFTVQLTPQYTGQLPPQQ
ncbi:hypothetical protein L218DRAFT_799286, partial [Marasmius fiardii PR-910]